ncbi:MAG: Fur family transcriptional regulator [Eubacteriales bacterium]
MAERTTYKTKQRDEILRFFMDHEDACFSARDIIAHVTAGEATVFRTLAALTKEGKLKKFTGGSGRGDCAYYQFNSSEECTSHIHLKCSGCGKLIHMDCTFMEEILTHLKREHAFSVDCGKTVIYGICGDCSGTPLTDSVSVECEQHKQGEVHHD